MIWFGELRPTRLIIPLLPEWNDVRSDVNYKSLCHLDQTAYVLMLDTDWILLLFPLRFLFISLYSSSSSWLSKNLPLDTDWRLPDEGTLVAFVDKEAIEAALLDLEFDDESWLFEEWLLLFFSECLLLLFTFLQEKKTRLPILMLARYIANASPVLLIHALKHIANLFAAIY